MRRRLTTQSILCPFLFIFGGILVAEPDVQEHKEVEQRHRTEQLERFEQLERILVATEDKVRKKRSELSNIVDSLGTGDSSTLNIAQQTALQQSGRRRTELSNVRLKLLKAETQLNARNEGRRKSGENAAEENSRVSQEIERTRAELNQKRETR